LGFEVAENPLVGAGNIRWTMPNSSGGHDDDLGAIEAVLEETARGRAFLADYARKVRQSDTLTMLAMTGRLDRWCQDQAVRNAKLEVRELVAGGGGLKVIPALLLSTAATDCGGNCGSVASLQNIRTFPAVRVCDQDPSSADRTSDDTGGEIASMVGNPEAIDRMELLADTFRVRDRRAADLTSRGRTTSQFTDTEPRALIASRDGEMGAMIAHSAA
jgi:hypothetical protein